MKSLFERLIKLKQGNLFYIEGDLVAQSFGLHTSGGSEMFARYSGKIEIERDSFDEEKYKIRKYQERTFPEIIEFSATVNNLREGNNTHKCLTDVKGLEINILIIERGGE